MDDGIPFQSGGMGSDAPAISLPVARPIRLEAEDAGDFAIVPTARPLSVEPPWPPIMSRVRAVVELIILLFVSCVGLIGVEIILIPWAIEDPRWGQLFGGVGVGCVALLACVTMMALARQKPASIGWTAKKFGFNVLLGLIGLGVVMASRIALVVSAVLIEPSLMEDLTQAQQGIEENLPRMQLMTMLIVMSFVAIWEEVVFRGFLLTRLQAVLRCWWLTILLSSVLFGLLHAYEGWFATVMIAVMGAIMGGLFVWRRSLVPAIVLHWLHNVGALVVLHAASTTWQ